jgi:hypothetical protein
MTLPVPDIPESQRTPLVLPLLDIIPQQQQHIARLEDEIARVKGLRPRPTVQPSTREAPAPKPPDPHRKRPDSANAPRERPPLHPPRGPRPSAQPAPGATRKGDQDFVVQAPVFEARNTRYRRERRRLPDGRTVLAAWPDDVAADHHLGPTPRAFAPHRYHGQRVTQPLLLARPRQAGIGTPAGRLSRLLTEGQEPFHQGKAESLPAARGGRRGRRGGGRAGVTEGRHGGAQRDNSPPARSQTAPEVIEKLRSVGATPLFALVCASGSLALISRGNCDK